MFNLNLIFSVLIYFCFGIFLTNCFDNKNGFKLNIVREGDRFTAYNSLGDWIGRGAFKNAINESGYTIFEVETNDAVVDEEQALSAGQIEGSLAYEIIYAQWYNTVKDFCDRNKTACAVIDKFIAENTVWVKNSVKKNPKNTFWYHVNLYYLQMYGIMLGYNDAAARYSFPNLTFVDIIKLNIYPEMFDILESQGVKHVTGQGSCSVLIKILPNNKDVYFGHNTWSDYRSMIRVMKNYMLGFHKNSDSRDIIPGKQTTFTSYPASISSIDDFYLISSGLAVTETSIEIFNKTQWKHVSPSNMVWESVRSVVANRLATSGKSWSNIFQLYNSGTYNNQWMVFDYKKFKKGNPPRQDAFWVIEQTPSKIVAKDLTNILIKNTYWSSYNIPYYKEIYDLADYNSMAQKYGDWFVHDQAPRAKIFKRDQVNVTSMEAFLALMRSNDFKHDPYARCKCSPPYTASGAIAARHDLNLVNGTYPFKGIAHRSSGAIDAKITNSQLFSGLRFTVIFGPTKGTNSNLGSFQWSKSDFNDLPHFMHPDIWDFPPVTFKWSVA